MADFEPDGRQVFDDQIGGMRDAFPGEIVKPDEEKTLNRLMREADEVFRAIFNPIQGQLDPNQREAIEAAVRLLREKERREYLKVIRTNPRDILVGSIQELIDAAPRGANALIGSYIDVLNSIRRNILDVMTSVNRLRTIDQVKGEPIKTDGEYIQVFIGRQPSSFVTIATFSPPGGFNEQFVSTQALAILGKLEIKSLPRAQNLIQLISLIGAAGNKKDSNRPTASVFGQGDQRSCVLSGLSSSKVGLEGVNTTLSFGFGNGSYRLTELRILGGENVWSKIIESESRISSPSVDPSDRRRIPF